MQIMLNNVVREDSEVNAPDLSSHNMGQCCPSCSLLFHHQLDDSFSQSHKTLKQILSKVSFVISNAEMEMSVKQGCGPTIEEFRSYSAIFFDR